MIKTIIAASMLAMAAAECPNACSGHGTCGNFDMCTCYRNWQAADCSQRTCPFDLAHVDTPKGDLDHSNTVTSATLLQSSTVYPKGTQEQFPSMKNGDSTATLANTAHYYMECSNKGICDRNTGECECFEGYDGYACQRASCPNDCSGHGTCETIEELAADDFNNVYSLWDAKMSMGCKCDAGYASADCSSRRCKVGVDPLYIDDTTARVTTTSIRFAAAAGNTLSGTYAIKFYDYFGEDYVTEPLTLVTSTNNNICPEIVTALTNLPNNVVPAVLCSVTGNSGVVGYKVALTFTSNPGYLRQLEVDQNLDGSRVTLSATNNGVVTAVSVQVFQEGTTGEDTDHFATKCAGVEASITAQGTWTVATPASDIDTTPATVEPGSLGYIDGLDAAEIKLLKSCLGDSDGDLTNNVDVFNWDYGVLSENLFHKASDGSVYALGVDYADSGAFVGFMKNNVIGSFPHAIKTVPTAMTTSYHTGEYHLVWYDDSYTAAEDEQRFRVANLPATDGVLSYIFTTDGTVQQLGFDNAGLTGGGDSDNEFTANKNETRVLGYFSQYSNLVYTNKDISCENDNGFAMACVEKGDRLFIIDGCWGHGLTGGYIGGPVVSCGTAAAASKATGNLYTVNKIYTKPFTATTFDYDEDPTNDVAGGLNENTWLSANHNVFSNVDTEKEDRFVIEVDYNIPWDGSAIENVGKDLAGVGSNYLYDANSGVVFLFKFTPATTGTYTFVAECSNRGTCDGETGLCVCFKGYTGDDCSTQNALAV